MKFVRFLFCLVVFCFIWFMFCWHIIVPRIKKKEKEEEKQNTNSMRDIDAWIYEDIDD